MRLQKYLALCGVSSRRNAEKMIFLMSSDFVNFLHHSFLLICCFGLKEYELQGKLNMRLRQMKDTGLYHLMQYPERMKQKLK